ncbi:MULTISPECIES: N-acetylmuramic acid 6-phosphate etherase [Staphylococcus]|jgi:N-acetylmuramic acid 6-phosphate etherase|uniref:N-acetylmuramic acid 6-phosphate etherase n=1 Tax=Staphylococcus TaxID=1279 RepID=UPI0001EF4BAC|nr:MULTISPECIES: N-acetylmuramic acid 6-phosphate etherase [Staphylococcus]EFS16058.1 N-acetylmuramic acid 6-phosphate etherase [Staphylococcus capitis C87]MBC3071335.1 N-acetylmuramic acid 6-phosphate etherase [Staphylococcus capitis]MBC3082265.1 N-acetylmuramic acid 6-phosphate etherase [Staphylococcus capitis]MBC3086846.1 N-acetylmuramic acid 6-phosphate etherase [Staphylococcus capitis]MBF2262193.1 N-acetylmuramic acid 6-phosphate etherase [Staphylococcus capitis]
MNRLTTETRNTQTMHLDEMTIQDALLTINREDQKVPKAIEQVIPQLSQVITSAIQRFNRGGRIIYIGAGTSGRLGVLDAAECVPTFNTRPEEVVGIIAGGQKAMTVAVEGAEDDSEQGAQDLKDIQLNDNDIVIGISASGRTPYVKGALTYANDIHADTVALSCNTNSEISACAEHILEVNVGPEVLTGSTRLKSGTAQKLILNMISTMTMIGVGKVYDNLMVDLRPTNKKLVNRSITIIQDICDLDEQDAQTLYEEAGNHIKTAVVMYLCNTTKEDAETRLYKSNGVIKQAINV